MPKQDKHPVYFLHIPNIDNLKLIELIAKQSAIKQSIMFACVEPILMSDLYSHLTQYNETKLRKAIRELRQAGWIQDLWHHVDAGAYIPTYDDNQRNHVHISFSRVSKFKSRS
jgi:hypothetical protein